WWWPAKLRLHRFFFQAEDGIRDKLVTGVQTCALPICVVRRAISVVKKRTGTHESTIREFQIGPDCLHLGAALTEFQGVLTGVPRSEERRVGKECRCGRGRAQ